MTEFQSHSGIHTGLSHTLGSGADTLLVAVETACDFLELDLQSSGAFSS